MITCFIDDREQSRVKPAYNFFKNANKNKHNLEQYQVYVLELPIGDYVFKGDNGITVAFEYKTIEDYLGSLSDNRVFNQALDQSNNFDYHFIIVVGTPDELNTLIREKQSYTGRYMTLREYYGSFGSLLNVTSIIQVPNQNHAFQCMESTARHCIDTKPVLKRFPKSRGTPALRLLANNVEKVGYKTAEKICDKLHLLTIDDVLGLKKERLVEVDGIGDRKADIILKQLKDL